ncbi:ATP-dependent helicase [Actinomyces weissii]|uniref:DNA 3'-5' helicase n=1 Tax=Actinomyces weissii TaxID=675090 RepID=A0A7T7M8K2_9ACTO|nr:UvrD-helicase domain-containing protein [Actinomyces weissii]QQM66918.1 UvrD-helicase domain-containing protein [Actinomyces weissii]
MNAMNSLFGDLPMPGASNAGNGSSPSRSHASESSLPPIAPASGWDTGWEDLEPPADDESLPLDPQAAQHWDSPTAQDYDAHLAEVSAQVARAQAQAAAARARATGEPTQATGSTPAPGLDHAPASTPAPGRADAPANPLSSQQDPLVEGTALSRWGREGNLTVSDPAALTHGLNPQQAAAVTHAGSPLLIIAGAGSGKTRVLTHRIAYLLATGRARAGEVLAITFTNKAAAEMRERVTALVGPVAQHMWVFTFHSACVRILRREHEAASLRSSFSIYDAADSQRLVTLVVKELGIDPKRFTPKAFAHRISDLKNELVGPAELAERAITSNPFERHLVEVYRAYQQRLVAANALDFDDIIMRTVELLRSRPGVAEMYRRRFRHVLVDEYQDTNHAQYVLVRELVGGPGTSGAGSPLPPAELTVVGDSDQSIYAFRGATIRNIEEFEQDYPQARTILLEQNYRSTQNILDAANAVIARNTGRRPKRLFTESGAGAPVTGYVADSEHDEARWVSNEIDRLADTAGTRPRDVAVFYRTNAQSRALEEAFIRAGQPYKVVGGTRFYERREIKDAIAYLRAVDNPDDDVSIRRVLNVPKRGLGDKAEAGLAEHAARHGVSFGRAVADAAGEPRPAAASGTAGASGPEAAARERQQPGAASASGGTGGPDLASPTVGEDDAALLTEPPAVLGLTSRALKQVKGFHELLVSLRHQLADGDGVAEVLDSALDASGYLAELRASDDPQDATRVENLAELHSVASDFQEANPDGTLADFLERVSLVADSDQLPQAADLAEMTEAEAAAAQQEAAAGQVTLMTVHTAKGLEFPVVFVTGMEDGTFPHARSLGEETELAEERRLAYVALTRARERLYVTRAAVRSAWGAANAMPASRFLDDIPAETMDWKRLASSTEALHGDSMGWGRSWGEGGFGSGRGTSGRRAGGSAYSEDDDFAPPIGGGGRSGRLGRVETAKDRAAARRAQRLEARGKAVRLDGSAAPATAGGSKTTASASAGAGEAPQFRVGDRVRHESYGEGTVTALEHRGRAPVVHVEFTIDGVPTTKRLMVGFAKFEKV